MLLENSLSLSRRFDSIRPSQRKKIHRVAWNLVCYLFFPEAKSGDITTAMLQ